MYARQNAGADGDGADGNGVTAVNAGFFGKDAVTHYAVFEFMYGVANCCSGPAAFANQGCLCLFVNGGNGVLAFEFVGDLVGSDEFVAGQFADSVVQGLVLRFCLPVPSRFARFGGQFADGVDGRLHLLVSEHDGTKHDFFG